MMSLSLKIWIGIVTISYIIGFLQIYGLYYFKSISNLLIIKKRYPHIVTVEAVAAIILSMIGIPFWFNAIFEATTLGISPSVYLIGWAILSPINQFIVNLEASRLWLMSFNLHYLHSFKNKKWKSQIDDRFADKNWYLANKQKYGNRNWILSRVMIYYLVGSSVCTVCNLYFQIDGYHISIMIDGVFLFVPICFTLYTYYKCPKHTESNDNFLIHYELRATAIIFTVGWISMFLGAIIHRFGPKMLHYILLSLNAMWSLLLPSLLSTLWIPRKILVSTNWTHDINEFEPSSQSISEMIIAAKKTGKNNLQRLIMVLCDEQKFEVFVDWMYREFSSETILCFIELVQFKHYLVNMMKESGNNEQIECKYGFYANIPKSSIIYGTGTGTVIDLNDAKEQEREKDIAHKLYKKYIATDDEFEANISAAMRDKYRKMDQVNNWNIEMKEMVNVFDDVIDEMFYLMAQSYVRFESSV